MLYLTHSSTGIVLKSGDHADDYVTRMRNRDIIGRLSAQQAHVAKLKEVCVCVCMCVCVCVCGDVEVCLGNSGLECIH